MKNASKLNSNLPPLNLPLKGGEVEGVDFFPLKGGEQKRGLFNYNSNSAFTLVELAIVVVVLGILIGGIVAGQTIIEASERQGVVTEIKQMQTALNAFELEYDGWAGDLKEAYDYFGDECGADSDDPGSGCNGNGDKCIGGVGTYECPFGNSILSGDARRVFVHLNLSEIYKLPYMTGRGADQTKGCIFGVSLPESANGDTYYLYSTQPRSLNMIYGRSSYSDNNDHDCRITGTANYHPSYVKKIDKKIDDGNAKRGLLTSRFTDADCANPDTGIYNVDYPRSECSMIIKMK